jgi:hypothetical protein
MGESIDVAPLRVEGKVEVESFDRRTEEFEELGRKTDSRIPSSSYALLRKVDFEGSYLLERFERNDVGRRKSEIERGSDGESAKIRENEGRRNRLSSEVPRLEGTLESEEIGSKVEFSHVAAEIKEDSKGVVRVILVRGFHLDAVDVAEALVNVELVMRHRSCEVTGNFEGASVGEIVKEESEVDGREAQSSAFLRGERATYTGH